MILAGDIGGTKTLLALERAGPGIPERLFEARYPSAAFASFDDLLAQFLREAGLDSAIEAACLAVAGPVEAGRRARITNLPWALDADALAARFGIPHVLLMNDFAAIGHALDALPAGSFVTLRQGRPQTDAPRLIVGAGTGLGVCIVTRRADGLHVQATEGGHAGFSPANEAEVRLLEHVAAREGRCAREHLLSGSGIFRIFGFVREVERLEPGEALRAALGECEDPAAAITRFALEGCDEAAHRTLALFVEIYGSQVGDIALGLVPRGGIYIAGGIAPRILPLLTDGRFLEALCRKPPMEALLAELPVHVVIDTDAGLSGALLVAHGLRTA